MSIMHSVFGPHSVILSAVTNFLLATLPLDFGGRFLGQHFTYDVAPTIVAPVHMESPPMVLSLS